MAEENSKITRRLMHSEGIPVLCRGVLEFFGWPGPCRFVLGFGIRNDPINFDCERNDRACGGLPESRACPTSNDVANKNDNNVGYYTEE